MPSALPSKTQRQRFERLGDLYLVAFWVAAASFYVSVARDGFQTQLALLAFTSAAFACLLRRIAGRLAAPVSIRSSGRGAALPIEGDLLARIDELLREERHSPGQVGVMLVSLFGFGEDSVQTPPSDATQLIIGELYRAADSRIFQIDERTLAIAEHRQDAVRHFDALSTELQAELRAARSQARIRSVRVTVGAAVTERPKASAGELLKNARAAVRLAEAQGRDTFFRHV